MRIRGLGLNVGCGGGTYPFYEPIIPLDVNLDIEPIRGIPNFIRADAERLPFRSHIFEVIFASHIIEHLRNPSNFLKEAYRTMKRKGMIYIAIPNFLSKNARADPSHLNLYHYVKIHFELLKAGFIPKSEYSPASLLPRPLRILVLVFFNLLCETIRIRGVKL